MAERFPYHEGWDAAEQARGRFTNPYTPNTADWRHWESGYGDYLSARAEMYEDEDE